MAQVPREDLFDSESVEVLLDAVGVPAGTAEAQLVLRDLWSAVELYRELFPDGRPNAAREVTVRRKLLARARASEVPGAIATAVRSYHWAVVVAEQKSYTEAGRLSSQLAAQLAAFSPAAKKGLADQLSLEFSRRLPVGHVMNVLAALKAACEDFSRIDTRRPRRRHRYDIQWLVDWVVPTFVEHYTKWQPRRSPRARRSRNSRPDEVLEVIVSVLGGDLAGEIPTRDLELELERQLARLAQKESFSKTSFYRDLNTVLWRCFSNAGVHAKLDPAGERAWRDYVLPSLTQLRKQHRHKALVGLLGWEAKAERRDI